MGVRAVGMEAERLARVAGVLARLSEPKIDDNWSNKPERSPETIFRSWMPQTAATVDQRCAALETVTRRYPEVGWRLCVDQFDPSSSVGDYGYRPRWRKDASGAGQPVGGSERYTFARKALDLAIEWPNHDERTLGDLVQHVHSLPEPDQGRIWDKIRAWIATNQVMRRRRSCASRFGFIRSRAVLENRQRRRNRKTVRVNSTSSLLRAIQSCATSGSLSGNGLRNPGKNSTVTPKSSIITSGRRKSRDFVLRQLQKSGRLRARKAFSGCAKWVRPRVWSAQS